jgi:hypothetical protein
MRLLRALGARNFARRFALAALVCAGTAVPLKADIFEITYDAAGVTSPTASTICASASKCLLDEETFNEAWSEPSFNATWTSLESLNVSGDSFTGKYAGTTSLTRDAAGEYGGSQGTSGDYYAEVSNGSYTLTLTATGITGANYFGLWLSAVDADNTISIYNTAGTLLYTLTAATLIAKLGACTGAHPSAYCGNPTTGFKGDDSGEQFVFLNFYDLNGTFGKVTFTEDDASGLETDDQTVGFISTITMTGTPLYTNGPEPGSFALLSIGAIAMIALKRRC